MNEKAIILVIDDDPKVRKSTKDILNRADFAKAYRVRTASSGPDGLREVRRYSLRNEEVALFLVDQKMGGMSGIEFLEQAIRYYPTARRAVFSAVQGEEAAGAAIEGINRIKLERFIVKGAGRAYEQRFQAELSSLLYEWSEDTPRLLRGCRLIGTEELEPGPTTAIKTLLAASLVSYQWLDVAEEESARVLADSITGGTPRLPIVLFPGDEAPLIQPSEAELSHRLAGLARPPEEIFDLIVIGAGPAGMKAALFAGSEGLKTCVIEQAGFTGGRARESARIDNYLGFPVGIRGRDLMKLATQQVRRFGVEVFAPLTATRIRVEGLERYVGIGNERELKGRSILLASGAKLNELSETEIPGVSQYVGKGIYYGSIIARAERIMGREVFVLGGGNSAAQAALFIARLAKKVTILIRSAQGLAKETSDYLIENIERRKDNIEVRSGARIASVRGDADGRLTGIRLDGETGFLDASAVFVFIGATPRTEYLTGVVAMDKGYVLTGREVIGEDLTAFRNRLSEYRSLKRQPILEKPGDGGLPQAMYYPYWLESSVPGIFVAGDVRASIINQRITTAVGEACTSIGFVHLYLKDTCLGPNDGG